VVTCGGSGTVRRSKVGLAVGVSVFSGLLRGRPVAAVSAAADASNRFCHRLLWSLGMIRAEVLSTGVSGVPGLLVGRCVVLGG
jgi:hypothetical protein